MSFCSRYSVIKRRAQTRLAKLWAVPGSVRKIALRYPWPPPRFIAYNPPKKRRTDGANWIHRSGDHGEADEPEFIKSRLFAGRVRCRSCRPGGIGAGRR